MRSAVLLKFKGSSVAMDHYSKAGVGREAFKDLLKNGADIDRAELWTSDGGRVKRSKKFGMLETRELSGARAIAGADSAQDKSNDNQRDPGVKPMNLSAKKKHSKKKHS